MKRISVMVLVALYITTSSLNRVLASAGDLDATFGTAGRVNTEFFGWWDEVRGVAIQPDGKIIAAGFAGSSRGPSDFAVVRYNDDGSLDSTFGDAGKVTTDFFDDSDQGFGLALQPDGRIIVAGITFPVTGGPVFGLVRYNDDGSLDSTFGLSGKVTTNLAGGDDMALCVALQPDGKIIAAGGVSNFGTGLDFAIVRYNSDGSLDETFGDGGKVTTDFSNGADRAFDLLIQPDGKIIAGGFTNEIGVSLDFGLARYNGNGSLDQSFGTSGKTATDFFGARDVLTGLAQQSDGKIIAVGAVTVEGGGFDFGVVRFNANGFMDQSFGSGGKLVTDFFKGNDQATGVVIQRDGKIVVAGFSTGDGVVQDQDFALARYRSNGDLDQGFGEGGKATTDFFGKNDQALCLAIQEDGRIVAAGTAGPPTVNSDFALARYEASSFDTCLEDDNSSIILQIDSATGDYQFSNCDGLTLSGTGTLSIRGCNMILQHTASDRRIMATVNTCSNRATASIQLLSEGMRFNLTDRNTANNTCACE